MTNEHMCEPEEACPKCSERRIDWLAWDEFSETVTCSTCGTTYNPNEWSEIMEATE